MRLQGTAILVLPDKNPEKTKGGIIIALEKDPPKSGVVIAYGPGCELVKSGDRIQYHRKGSSIMEVDGVEHHLIIEDLIFYVH